MPVRGLFMGLCPKPRTPAFLRKKSRAKELNFSCFTLSFRAGIYGTKTGMVSRKMKLVIFTCLSAKLQRRFAAREYCSGASPPGGFLWCSAPNPARFFEKSVGKIMFCRKASHSFHSCDTLRLLSFFIWMLALV